MDRPLDVLGYYTSRHALPSEYVLPALGVLALVVFCGWYFSKPQKLKRELRRAPRFKITDLPDSTLGRIVGVARPIGEPLTSPLNGRSCLYFISTVSTTGRGARVVAREERGVAFLLEDDTGRAIVDPQGADVALDQDEHSSSGTLDNPTEVEARFLARHGEVSKGLVFNRALVYREQTIAVGETIAVLGAAVREPDPDVQPTSVGYREAQPMRLRLASSARMRLRISDSKSTTA